jgi:Leucine-rich repeat (LRR) protein
LSSNRLTELPTEIANLMQLRTLCLSFNRLTELPTEIGNLTQLQALYLDNNKLTELPTEICNLTQLQALYLNDNQLTELPTEICNLTQLQELYLNDNKLMTIPVGIIYLPNLSLVTYRNNEITNLHPAITRWLNRSKTAQNVYSNNQSVHDHNIESTTNASIIKFISGYKVNNTDVFDLIDGFSIDYKTQSLLKYYCNSDYIHSNLKLTFGEVALPVLDYINGHHNKQDLLRILQDEIIASEGKCFQGRLSRLLNVLNGYHPDIHINISDNEQIGNIVIMLKQKYTDLDELISFFVTEMNERNYEQNMVDEWITYIKENH